MLLLARGLACRPLRNQLCGRHQGALILSLTHSASPERSAVKYPFDSGYIFCNKVNALRPARTGFQKAYLFGCNRMKGSLSAMRRATSSCSQGDSVEDSFVAPAHGMCAHLFAAMGSKLGGRSLGMQMKVVMIRWLSILIHDQAPKPMCHLPSVAIACPLRSMCLGVCSASFALPTLCHRTQHLDL